MTQKMDFLIVIVVTLGSLSVTGESSKDSINNNNCVHLPNSEIEILELKSFWSYDATLGSLGVDLTKVVSVDSSNCKNASDHRVRVDLVSTSATSSSKSSCLKPKKDSFVQSSAVVNETSLNLTFTNVKGLYYLRLSHCGLTKSGSCKMLKGDDRRVFCIGRRVDDDEPLNFDSSSDQSEKDNATTNDDGESISSCEFEVPTKVSVDVVDSSPTDAMVNFTADVDSDQCDINVRVVVPLCKSQEMHDTVTLTLVDANEAAEVCTFADFEAAQKINSTDKIDLMPCPVEDSNSTTGFHCGSDVTNATQAAFLDHDVRNLSRNASYCLFFRLNSPNCQGQFSCVFYTEVISCNLIEASRRHSYRMIITEPVFIAGVSLTLIASLALLAWTVIQVSSN